MKNVCKRVGVNFKGCKNELAGHRLENELCLGDQGTRIVKPLVKLAIPSKAKNLSFLYGKLVIFFSTTHLVENTFSALAQIKSKYRCNMTDTTVDILLRCAVAGSPPDFKAILDGHSEFHPSH